MFCVSVQISCTKLQHDFGKQQMQWYLDPIGITWSTAHVECLLKTSSFFIKSSEDFFLFAYSVGATLFPGCIWATETPQQFDLMELLWNR